MGTFEIKDGEFSLNGEKFRLFSGAIHYFRTVPEYWEDRLKKLKLAGFNTVETYVPWNWHEKTPGEFSFDWILDVVRFIETAKKVGLWVIMRPGPYICAEWDMGGLPAWLLADPQMRVRCMYKPYLEAVERFYKKLLPLITPHQITNGGNILAMQVENEYGSYGNDKHYLAWIEKLMRECGVDVLLFTSDGPNDDMLVGGTLPHIYKTGNLGSFPRIQLQKMRKVEKHGPLTCMEFWLGWFDHWGLKHHVRKPKSVLGDVNSMLDMGANFNLYMFHGGTNFGMWAGANRGEKYTPTTTSYDYDAPLNEWGGYTKKYHALREAMLNYQGLPKEELPPEPLRQNIGRIELTEKTGLFENLALLGEKHISVTAESMEFYGQNHGFIMYDYEVRGHYGNVNINLDGLHDFAYVYVNDTLKGTCYRDRNTSINVRLADGDRVRVLVDAMGRVNYGPDIHDRKGLKRFKINAQICTHFEVTTLPFDNIEKIDFTREAVKSEPVFLRGKFSLKKTGAPYFPDTFVHLSGFRKGMVFINGFNLGRYWEDGPQRSLYLPGPLLKEENEIVVFDAEWKGATSVELKDTHILG